MVNTLDPLRISRKRPFPVMELTIAPKDFYEPRESIAAIQPMEPLRRHLQDCNANEIALPGTSKPSSRTCLHPANGTTPERSLPIPVSQEAPPAFDLHGICRAFTPTSPRPTHPTSLSRLSSNIYIASSCPSYQPDSIFAENFLNHLEQSGADNDRLVYTTFMKAHSCYDITPTHSKILAVDTKMPVHKAWSFLNDQEQGAALLWSEERKDYVGMLTITDFIRVYIEEYKKDPSGDRVKELTNETIESWLQLLDESERPQELITVNSTDCLYTAVEALCSNEIHRLPVVEDGHIVFMITHRVVLKFMHTYVEQLPRPDFMSKTPKELRMGTWFDIWVVDEWMPLIEVLRLLMKEGISAVPVTCSDGNIRAFARADIITVAAKLKYAIDLSMPVKEALELCGKSHGHQYVFSTDESLKQIVETIVTNGIRRVYITDESNQIIAAISLSDILKTIVLSPLSHNSSRSNSQINFL
ncbi:hypothetical protein L596_023594 [Steinernema carpocapsae]|uniref:CBS domain-containing protein n=1 Tax=Steinernema carpocapsae TaxID=34508 RepID=A0A4U5MEW8_STECR|nr:hypothetical protein L596_023594 [Steinernema carpocapsae]